MLSVKIFMVGLFRFLSSGWWQHLVLPIIAETLEEPPASIFKVEVSEMMMWPDYVGTMTQKGERKYSSDLELWETSLSYQVEETFNLLSFLHGINERLPGSTQGETSLSHSCDQFLASRFLDLGLCSLG